MFTSPDDRSQFLTFWVNSEIDGFRVHPDTNAFAFRVLEIVLLVPPDDHPVAHSAARDGSGLQEIRHP
jgi:hypothetical protein